MQQRLLPILFFGLLSFGGCAKTAAEPSLTETLWQLSGAGEGQVPSVRFGPDGKVTGNGGCNRFSGTYRVDGDRITIGPRLVTTRMMCRGKMETERKFLHALTAVTRWDIERGSLHLRDDAKTVTMAFTAKPADRP